MTDLDKLIEFVMYRFAHVRLILLDIYYDNIGCDIVVRYTIPIRHGQTTTFCTTYKAEADIIMDLFSHNNYYILIGFNRDMYRMIKTNNYPSKCKVRHSKEIDNRREIKLKDIHLRYNGVLYGLDKDCLFGIKKG